MNLSQLSDEDIEKALEVCDTHLMGKSSFWNYILLNEIVDLYEERLRRWSEKRKFKKTQAA